LSIFYVTVASQSLLLNTISALRVQSGGNYYPCRLFDILFFQWGKNRSSYPCTRTVVVEDRGVEVDWLFVIAISGRDRGGSTDSACKKWALISGTRAARIVAWRN